MLATPLGARAQEAPAIRFLAPAVEPWMQAYFAQATGRFEKAGLNVQLTVPASAANILTSVATGDADFGIAATTAIGMAIAGGLPLVVVAAAVRSSKQAPTESLCVGKSSPIERPKDFEGKTVGVIGLRQFGDVALRMWLIAGGADVSTVRVIQAPFSAMGAGIDRGTYDAAVFTEPTLAYALKNDAIRCIAHPDMAVAPAFTLGAWVTTKQYAAAHPDIVRRVVAVLNETARWANAHRDDTAVLVSKLGKIDLDLVRAETNRPVYADRLNPAELQAPLDAAYALHFLPRRVTANEMLGEMLGR